MANKAKGYGLTAELNRKKQAKYDPDLALEAFSWMREVLMTGSQEDQTLAEELGPADTTAEAQKPLKDGIILCHVVNIIKPGSIKKINKNKRAFNQMENIGNFLEACVSLGCNKIDLFQTADLYDGSNITQVINTIYALGRKARKIGYGGPCLGPEEATENPREFSEEQLRAGESVIGLQAGSNKGASQAGQNFGKTRAIID